jgi:hypothetical protein
MLELIIELFVAVLYLIITHLEPHGKQNLRDQLGPLQ